LGVRQVFFRTRTIVMGMRFYRNGKDAITPDRATQLTATRPITQVMV
jgi:hypothetical protein